MPFFRSAHSPRSFERKADGFAAYLRIEPSPDDVAWLAGAATKGDDDHAAWELRYARRALGVLVAQRDALDDRTGSAVARAVSGGFATDPAIDPKMIDVAVAQFNARLSAYRDILQTRAGVPMGMRLGQMLLAFAGGPIGKDPQSVQQAGEILAGYLSEASAALQSAFGAPTLPDDVPPSALTR
ncbi:MAG: hypothetical protein H0X64_08910 [Gemmatimonadaceae bacterium]|nr:hypothetical protein [Gemmatimonadaceae bacterium]